ncbi:hypothetical protein C5167_040208 [Papaver somniferum]|uniref:Uncharacterized protein n=1 Tax=Papaver somniferum TaxID=3469 RepID=A0A4Y7IEG7_PAPSO|nr:hypothetical protein C5167_040208 [Papaver somniferum]
MRIIEIEEENSNTEGIPTKSDFIDIDGVKPNIKPVVGMKFKSILVLI